MIRWFAICIVICIVFCVSSRVNADVVDSSIPNDLSPLYTGGPVIFDTGIPGLNGNVFVTVTTAGSSAGGALNLPASVPLTWDDPIGYGGWRANRDSSAVNLGQAWTFSFSEPVIFTIENAPNGQSAIVTGESLRVSSPEILDGTFGPLTSDGTFIPPGIDGTQRTMLGDLTSSILFSAVDSGSNADALFTVTNITPVSSVTIDYFRSPGTSATGNPSREPFRVSIQPAPIPEPGTLVLAGITALYGIGYRRRKRKVSLS